MVSHDHLNFHFKCSVTEDLRRFFGGVNSILTSIHRAMENVLTQIFNANCAPKVIYGDEVKDHNAWEMNQSKVALNGAISNLRVCYWQSI